MQPPVIILDHKDTSDSIQLKHINNELIKMKRNKYNIWIASSAIKYQPSTTAQQWDRESV